MTRRGKVDIDPASSKSFCLLSFFLNLELCDILLLYVKHSLLSYFTSLCYVPHPQRGS